MATPEGDGSVSERLPDFCNQTSTDYDPECRSRDDEKEFDKERLLKEAAMDKGFAWMVVLGGFMMWLLFGGFMRSEGVFFLAFTSRYQTSAQLLGWLGGTLAALQYFTSPLVVAFTNRYSVRTGAMLAALFSSVGFILSSFAPNIYFLFFSYSILQGLARSLTLSTAVILINKYFLKYRGQALALACSGGGVGGAIMLPLVRWLLDTYGFQGTFLLLGAMFLNAYVGALLLRPFTFHLRLTRALTRDSQELRDVRCAGSSCMEREAKHHSRLVSALSGSSTSDRAREPLLRALEKGQKGVNKNDYNRKNSNTYHSISDLFDEKDDKENYVRKLSAFLDQQFEVCVKSVKEALTIFFPVDSYRTTESGVKPVIFHTSVLNNVSFHLAGLACVFFQVAQKIGLDFFPVIAYEKGFSDGEVFVAEACLQVFDIGGKLISGYVMDLPRMRNHQYSLFIFSQTMMGVACALVPCANTTVSLAAVGAMYGFFLSANNNQRYGVVAWLVGDEAFSTAFGLYQVFQGVGSLISPPAAGALKDAYSTFDYAFYVSACSLVIAVGLCVVSFRLAKGKNKDTPEPSSG